MAKYFQASEFTCRCFRPDCPAPRVSACLMDALDTVREAIGYPIIVTSGLRCPEYNARVGGAPTSAHMDGTAADIRVPSSRARHEILSAAIPLFRRIGVGRDFIHLDVSTRDAHPQDVVWLY